LTGQQGEQDNLSHNIDFYPFFATIHFMGSPEYLSRKKFFPRVGAAVKDIATTYLDDIDKLRFQRLLRRIGFEGTQQDHHQTLQNIFQNYLTKARAQRDGLIYERDSSEDNRFGIETIYKGFKLMGYRRTDFNPEPGDYETETCVTIETNAGFPDVGLRLVEFPEIEGEREAPILQGGFYTDDNIIGQYFSDDPKRTRERKLK
jgi:hypothetical protein